MRARRPVQVLRSRLAAALAATVSLQLLMVAGVVSPASAHESDPQVQAELTSVEPALPAAVVVQVQANIAPQLVADNPTGTELDVVDSKGQPFLRLSSRGVFANLESRDFYTTNNFSGSDAAVPASVARRASPAAPRWTRLSAGSSWGWFDHRLDPPEDQVRDRTRGAVLGTWQIPFRYGNRPVTVEGRTRFEPLRGSFDVTVDPAPEGLTAQVLQGRLPGLFLATATDEQVTVLDEDGQPYVRLSAVGGALNIGSRLHLEDQRARGAEVASLQPPGVRFRPFSGGSRTWLDSRLRYVEGRPPESVLLASNPTVLRRWSVPLLIGKQSAALTGEVRWVPTAAAEQAVRGAPAAPERESAFIPAALVLGGLAAILAVIVAVRRRAA